MHGEATLCEMHMLWRAVLFFLMLLLLLIHGIPTGVYMLMGKCLEFHSHLERILMCRIAQSE